MNSPQHTFLVSKLNLERPGIGFKLPAGESQWVPATDFNGVEVGFWYSKYLETELTMHSPRLH